MKWLLWLAIGLCYSYLMLTTQQIEELHRKYAPNDKVYELVYGHCQVVNEIAQWCEATLAVRKW